MTTKRSASWAGFTLIEIMIAVLFLSIGFFGYVALHSRILHSGQKLEEREVIRAATDMFEALEVARVTLGFSKSINAQDYPVQPGFPDLHPLSTDASAGDMSWLLNFPKEYHAGMEETMELAPVIFAKPFVYSWGQP